MVDLIRHREVAAAAAKGSLLCVGAFPSNTGFAWDFIESLYAGVADLLANVSIASWVSYPSLNGRPQTLEGSAAQAVALPVDFGRPRSVRELIRFIRARGISVLYMADQPTWHPAYAALRLAGIRWIVVHAHASGERLRRRGAARRIKQLTRAIPGTLADRVIAVSDFVARRILDVDLVPMGRVVRIWNAVKAPDRPKEGAEEFRQRFDIPRDRPLILCAARAVPEKGVEHLFRAFDRVLDEGGLDPRPLLVYMGTGPYFEQLQATRQRLSHRDDIRMLGYVEGAARFLGAATLCVVPSVWQEAFGLAALEPMASGVPVVASAVGGVPEVVVDGETGVLVPPGDEEALAEALVDLLSDSDRRCEMGRVARRRAIQEFDFDDEVEAVYRVVAQGFGL